MSKNNKKKTAAVMISPGAFVPPSEERQKELRTMVETCVCPHIEKAAEWLNQQAALKAVTPEEALLLLLYTGLELATPAVEALIVFTAAKNGMKLSDEEERAIKHGLIEGLVDSVGLLLHHDKKLQMLKDLLNKTTACKHQ